MIASFLYWLPLKKPLSPLAFIDFLTFSAMAHLHFLIDLLAEQACRPDQKNNYKTSKYNRISKF